MKAAFFLSFYLATAAALAQTAPGELTGTRPSHRAAPPTRALRPLAGPLQQHLLNEDLMLRR